ncbi:MAG TPA: DUF4838 domain-containing protein [Chthoniobacteraceae bacterium]|nr:DUF4838 domain-containing protein [Chthoniobacteraceae bacterium]
MTTLSSHPKKLPATVLTADTSFSLEVDFPADPQIAEATAVTEGFLVRLGLRREEGAAWPVAVRKAAAPLAAGGYCLKSTDCGVVLEASEPEGVRCGLMALLEHLGVRWYDPFGEPLLPKLPIRLPALEETRAPSFPYRGLHLCGVPDQYDETMAQWMSFQRMNRKLTHIPHLSRVEEALKRQGIAPDTTVHSYSHWIADRKYFETHPGFFSLIDGKRVRHEEGGQLCLSNKAMRAALLSEVRAFLDAHPGAAVVGICPNDGLGWCECGDCLALDSESDRREGKVNGRVARFLEAVCGELAASHPGVLVGHYSYANFGDFHLALEKPPSNLLVSCTTFRCHRHAISDERCPTNQKLYARLKGLRRKIRHVYIYDYLFHRWNGLPQPQWRVIGRDLQTHARLGIDGYLSEVSPRAANAGDFAAGHLPLYLLARLLYDRTLSMDALLDDYTARRYGAAAAPMRSLLALWERAVENMNGCLRHMGDDLERLMSPELVREGRGLLAQAARLACGPHRDAVASETQLFEGWVEILRQRREARELPSRAALLPMEAFARDRDNPAADAAGLVFLDHALKTRPQEGRTTARLYAGGGRLAIVIECGEPKMACVADRPGNAAKAVYDESENVEIFLRDGSDASLCYHILISISGGHCAAESKANRWNWNWEGGYRVETRRFERHWKVFFEIPLGKINARDHVAFTLIRNRCTDGRKISGVPDGGVFFFLDNYLELALPEERL